jgi:ferredoxin-type protein NapH
MEAVSRRRRELQESAGFDLGKVRTPLVIMLAFWAIGILGYVWGRPFYLLNFGYIGSAIGVGIGLYGVLPRPRKVFGRKLTQFLVGGYMVGLLGLLARENMQLSGFFFYLLTGFFAGAVIHYLVAKIFGPFLFGRGWCGWACWTAMILDLLPFSRSRGRLPGKWGHFRYLMFAMTLGLVLTLLFLLHYRVEFNSVEELYWLLAGNGVYYAVGIGSAFTLKDNRAFCKYVCPIVLPLKTTSRFSLIKIGGNPALCDECGACMRVCPMDIRISDYIKSRGRVLSTECIFCLTCINSCPRDVLDITFGVDAGTKELLRERSVPPDS